MKNMLIYSLKRACRTQRGSHCARAVKRYQSLTTISKSTSSYSFRHDWQKEKSKLLGFTKVWKELCPCKLLACSHGAKLSSVSLVRKSLMSRGWRASLSIMAAQSQQSRSSSSGTSWDACRTRTRFFTSGSFGVDLVYHRILRIYATNTSSLSTRNMMSQDCLKLTLASLSLMCPITALRRSWKRSCWLPSSSLVALKNVELN